MSPRDQHKRFDIRQAKEIGARLKTLLGTESVISFAKRFGISRQWLHDILSGRVSPEASIATLSHISDTLGYSLEWLARGKGMPNDQWNEKTTLISRVLPKTNARKKITLEKQVEFKLERASILEGLETDLTDLGVLSGQNIDPGPLIGPLDEVLVDLKDHKPVNNGLFIAQVQDRLLACRAIKAHSVWLLSPTESITPEALIGDYRIIGRIRLVWKRV
jgi:transcriptional regulator with XRE-family HTH domain